MIKHQLQKTGKLFTHLQPCIRFSFLTLLRDITKGQFQYMKNIHLNEKFISEANS